MEITDCHTKGAAKTVYCKLQFMQFRCWDAAASTINALASNIISGDWWISETEKVERRNFK